MSSKGISDELGRQVADDLRARYDLDDELHGLDAARAGRIGNRTPSVRIPSAASRCRAATS